jgi:hypothetical protein
MLTKQEECSVKKISTTYYNNSIRSKTFQNKNRLFGIEIEFSIIDTDKKLIPRSAETISKISKNANIAPDYGSFQLEIHPPPIKLENKSFHKLYDIIQKIRTEIDNLGKERGIQLLPIGLPFYIDPLLLRSKDIVTQKNQYKISTQYFHSVNKNGSRISYHDGGDVVLPGNSGLSIINELHIHLQGLNVNDIINLFNYGQMITAPLVSLGANSGITNGKKLIHKEYQIKIFEEAEGIFDGIPNIPRTGLFPGYIKTLDDYFNIALSFKPLYYSKEYSQQKLFELLTSKYFAWTRIRLGTDPTSHLRIEFRPLSTQPTCIENIALSEFFIRSILHLIEKKTLLLPEKFLRMNFDESCSQGMDADLFWDFGEGIEKYPVDSILRHMFKWMDSGEFLHILDNRINEKRSPTDKLIEDTEKLGYWEACNLYLDGFEKEIPYI